MDQVSFNPEDAPLTTLTGIAVGDLAVVRDGALYTLYHPRSGSVLPMTSYVDQQDAIVLASLLTANGPLVTDTCGPGQGMCYATYSELAAPLREARSTLSELKLATDIPGNPLAPAIATRARLADVISGLNARGVVAQPAVRGIAA